MNLKKNLLTISMVSMIGVVLMASGCISTGTETGQNLQFINTPTADYYEDGSGLISGDLYNEGTTTYRDIDVEIIGYNQDHEKIFTDMEGIALLEPGQTASITRVLDSTDPHIYTVEMNIVNKTRTD